MGNFLVVQVTELKMTNAKTLGCKLKLLYILTLSVMYSAGQGVVMYAQGEEGV